MCGAWLAFIGVCLSFVWQASDAAISWCETTWPTHPWALRLVEWGHRFGTKAKRSGDWTDRTGMAAIVVGAFMVAQSLSALEMIVAGFIMAGHAHPYDDVIVPEEMKH